MKGSSQKYNKKKEGITMETTLKELIKSFAKSIDLYNYLLKSHHRRVTIAAYHIGKTYGLNQVQLSNLVIASALHDIGALTVKERDELIVMDVDNPHPHARLGSYMLDSFPPFEQISKIIFYHHFAYKDREHYIEQKGEVPIEAYIIHVADRLEILTNPMDSIRHQKKSLIQKITSYKGTLFQPKVVEAFEEVAKSDIFWLDINNVEMDQILEEGISKDLDVIMDLDLMEDFAYTISKIIDTRSKFTISHSFGVSKIAYILGQYMEYPEEKCRKLKVAGLLHDIGKIAIPTEMIEKNGALNELERENVQEHVYFTYLVLHNMAGLEEVADWATHHHENHLGTGYPEHLNKYDISEEMDIISYADIFTSLVENRPYREGLPLPKIMGMLEEDFQRKHGSKIFDIIRNHQEDLYQLCKEAVGQGENRYERYQSMSKEFEILQTG